MGAESSRFFGCSDVSYLLGNIDTNINNHQTNIVNDADSTDVMKITMLREMITLLIIQNIIRLHIYKCTLSYTHSHYNLKTCNN